MLSCCLQQKMKPPPLLKRLKRTVIDILLMIPRIVLKLPICLCLFLFVIQSAVAVAFEVGVGDLVAEGRHHRRHLRRRGVIKLDVEREKPDFWSDLHNTLQISMSNAQLASNKSAKSTYSEQFAEDFSPSAKNQYFFFLDYFRRRRK